MTSAPENEDVLGFGDVWTWTAIDPITKLVPSFMVGKRTAEYAEAFIGDLASRLAEQQQEEKHLRLLETLHAINRKHGDNVLSVCGARQKRRVGGAMGRFVYLLFCSPIVTLAFWTGAIGVKFERG